MPKPRKRKTAEPAENSTSKNSAFSEWTIETGILEPVKLRAVAPTIWRSAMAQLREDFLSARKEHGPLRCPLFQTTSSKSDEQLPPQDDCADSFLGRRSIYQLDLRQFVTHEGKLIFWKNPILDANGNPISDPQGRGIACTISSIRRWCYKGSPSAGTRFIELAERAGQAMLGSPTSAIKWIPHDTLLNDNGENRWAWSLFDLAWQKRHPSLSARRMTWFRTNESLAKTASDCVYVAYDLDAVRTLRKEAVGPGLGIPEAWAERLPGYYVSELPDVFQASTDLIDALLDIGSRQDTSEVSDAGGTPADSPPKIHSADEFARESDKKRQKTGRPSLPASTVRKYEQLADQWKRAKTARVSQRDFCIDQGIELKDLTKCLNFLAQRHRRSNSP